MSKKYYKWQLDATLVYSTVKRSNFFLLPWPYRTAPYRNKKGPTKRRIVRFFTILFNFLFVLYDFVKNRKKRLKRRGFLDLNVLN